MQVEGFPPCYSKHSEVLILGSMPGIKSLAQQQYYAHPRNAFWPIMQRLYGVDAQLDYALRCQALQQAGVALWDVLAQCQRQGSLDSAIKAESVVVNDISGLLKVCPNLRLIGLNGGAAAKLFKRHCQAALPSELKVVTLPSTSPAYAAMPVEQKQQRWAQLLTQP